ncbi:LysR family transcriptional regulator [Thiohalophilus sp.]|uniref:LysR family transcriptional regulator n=1 Tax=Thiohalophilus sp. TaxID=3028392 RepID=UPI002ACE8EE2|nr:LysR family transcriptional regulator [Thiohalophilus sp.]MDZ7802607.1 LysR family transcriptional regulator [Thiohalophilus sp.]
MDIEQARTFLAITANGSFLEAAHQLHLTQSTVSARLQRLEQELGARLFVRNRAGASLTPAGRRFLDYAKRLVLTADQARTEVGLPERYRASIRISGRIALWEGYLPQWVGWMRRQAPDVVIRSDIGFEEDIMRGLIEGSLDIGLMYTPTHSPGLMVEALFDETLILVSTRPDDTGPGEDYVYIEWGPGFYARHAQSYPDLEGPPQIANIGWLGVQLILTNGGSCFLPARMAIPFIEAGQLYRVADSPEFRHPAYMVYPRHSDHPVLEQALAGLRELAASQHVMA